MFPIINHISNRSIKIRNFEEDKIATLNANRGLRYEGFINNNFIFSGNYYLLDSLGELIQAFDIKICVGNTYPNFFPIVYLLDDKIDKIEDNHISDEGKICFDHNYVTNAIQKSGLRIYDFINYYLPKYFSWVLVKLHGDPKVLKEWAHGNEGTKQFYQTLLGTTDNKIIVVFLENFCNSPRIQRNEKCYCGSGKKIKQCHLIAVQYLKATPLKCILADIILFQ